MVSEGGAGAEGEAAGATLVGVPHHEGGAEEGEAPLGEAAARGAAGIGLARLGVRLRVDAAADCGECQN